MLTRLETRGWRQATAGAIALCLLVPSAALPVQAQIFGNRRQAPAANQRQGMSTKKKLVAVAGAALLYYLYKKHTASREAQSGVQGGMGTPRGGTAVSNRKPQLYRSKNGGVYYRNAQGRPVWLTVPSRGMQVPQDELQRYAPDYSRYRGPAPRAPQGYRTQDFSQFDPSLASADSGGGTTGMPPGPRSGR